METNETGLKLSCDTNIFTVYHIGDTATSFYIILNGAVKVKARDSPGEPLRTKANLTSGQSFGELALVKDTHR